MAVGYRFPRENTKAPTDESTILAKKAKFS